MVEHVHALITTAVQCNLAWISRFVFTVVKFGVDLTMQLPREATHGYVRPRAPNENA